METLMQTRTGIKLNYATGLYLEYVLALMVVACTVFHINRGVSYAFTATFVVFLLLVYRYISSRQLPAVLFFLVIFSFFNVIVNALLSRQAQIGPAYFRKLIMFCCTVVYFYTATEMKISEKGKNSIVFLALMMGVLMIGSYYLLGNRATIASSITLGFVNPNFAGMWLTHCFFYSTYVIIDAKKWPQKAIGVLVGVACLVLIYLTYARSCFLGIVVFVALLFVGLISGRKKFSKPVMIMIAIMPLVFALVYLSAVNVKWFKETFSFLVRAGKKLDARNKLWILALRSVTANPIFGSYSGISGGVGISQLHNTHIDVLASYGFAPLALFTWSLYELMRKVNQRINSFSQYTALCAFAGVIGIGCLEAGIVAGSTGLYFLSGGFLLLAGHDLTDIRNDST